MSDLFQDKVTLITGASSGIGAALAKELSRRGARLVLAARRVDKLKALALECGGKEGRAVAVAADVTAEGDMERAVAEAVRSFGRLDVVVANAGFGVVGTLDRLSTDDYRRQFETNVFGVIRTARAALAELRKSQGRLAIVGSVNGFVSLPSGTPYAMSKYAVRAFAEGLRAELLPDGIAVTHVAPGFVDSEIRQVDNQGRLHQAAKDPIPRWIRMPTDRAARQIAAAIAKRRREIIVTGHGKIIVFLCRHFPRLVAFVVSKVGVAARREPAAKRATAS